MTLHKLNFTQRAWMELKTGAPEREKQIVFAQMRENPESFLSGSLENGFGIIANGTPLYAEKKPLAEAIEYAVKAGVQTRFAWSAPKWIELGK
jgi:hypothetical protein